MTMLSPSRSFYHKNTTLEQRRVPGWIFMKMENGNDRLVGKASVPSRRGDCFNKLIPALPPAFWCNYNKAHRAKQLN